MYFKYINIYRYSTRYIVTKT